MKIEMLTYCETEFMEALTRLLPQLTPYSIIPTCNDINGIIASEGTSIWVARNDRQEITGMLTLAMYQTPTGRHAWIEDVVVDAAMRNQGIGLELTQAAIQFANSQGAKAISLTSRPERVAANRLYQKLGFQLLQTNLYRMNLNSE